MVHTGQHGTREPLTDGDAPGRFDYTFIPPKVQRSSVASGWNGLGGLPPGEQKVGGIPWRGGGRNTACRQGDW